MLASYNEVKHQAPADILYGVTKADVDAAVRDVIAGDRDRYRVVIAACETPVRVAVATVLPDGVSVDEVVPEVFLTAYLKLRDYRPGTDLIAWMKAIARNVALNERRRWLRQLQMTKRFRAEVETLMTPELEAVSDELPKQALSALAECVDALEPRTRDMVRSHYFDGTSYDDLASAGGRTTGWVRLKLFRARAAIGRCLAAKGAVLDG